MKGWLKIMLEELEEFRVVKTKRLKTANLSDLGEGLWWKWGDTNAFNSKFVDEDSAFLDIAGHDLSIQWMVGALEDSLQLKHKAPIIQISPTFKIVLGVGGSGSKLQIAPQPEDGPIPGNCRLH
ncbi:hypothetical protein HPP92_005315 [Vanilla planifolia]|uniref:Uncharacterized protein n=1 Tax=Vanilla planifolia TaxID=51239 RepID=A0A835VAV9_VANPL|nr:hypothetical protein HPP92_005315 [Vanilla planifolia]